MVFVKIYYQSGIFFGYWRSFYLIVEGVREAFFVTTVHPKETILSRVFNDESRKRGFE